jgi:hypothetical protein
MFVEHYSTDKRFKELPGYFPDLSPELKKIDASPEDEKLYRLIRDDLAKRYPKRTETGCHWHGGAKVASVSSSALTILVVVWRTGSTAPSAGSVGVLSPEIWPFLGEPKPLELFVC